MLWERAANVVEERLVEERAADGAVDPCSEEAVMGITVQRQVEVIAHPLLLLFVVNYSFLIVCVRLFA